MTIDHIGYAVKKTDRAIASFEKLGFVFDEPVKDTDRNIEITFGAHDGYRIELVMPLDKTRPSPVDAYLSKIGTTPYHICYRTDDLDAAVSDLIAQGFRVVIEPAPAVAFGGKRVVFLMNLGLGLMEIVEA